MGMSPLGNVKAYATVELILSGIYQPKMLVFANSTISLPRPIFQVWVDVRFGSLHYHAVTPWERERHS
jgi:hypothetical protein